MIPAWLTGIGAKIGVAAAVLVIIVGGWLYIRDLKAENKTLSVQVSQDEAVNKANVTAMTALQQQVAQANAVQADLSSDLQAEARTASSLHAAIRQEAAATGGDAAVAPVLSQTLDALRGGK